jgi:crotonobetainyl-CoA:carnitine CoA-transferase CaiB-like acyl-CoA transferase
VFVGVVSDSQWKVFCEAFGLQDLLADPALKTNPQRVEARPRILPIVTEIFGRMSKQALMARCDELGLPFAPISKPEDLFDDPHLNASGGLVPVTMPHSGIKTKVPSLPIAMNGARLGTRLDIPKIGEHTREVLGSLGYETAAVTQLVKSGAVSAL